MAGTVLSVFVTGGMWAILMYRYPDWETCEVWRPTMEQWAVVNGYKVTKSECNPRR